MIIDFGIKQFENEYSRGWYFRPFENNFLNVEYEETAYDDPSGSLLLQFGGDFGAQLNIGLGLGRHFAIEVYPRPRV